MIREEIIQRADEYLEKISEAEMEKYMKAIAKEQNVMVGYINAMSDVFEDEEDYFNKFMYFFLLVHRSYTNRFRFFPVISNEIIAQTEEEDQAIFSAMMEKGDDSFEKEFESMLRKHPQRVLIDFITMDLFEANEEDYDEITLDLDNQIFFLLITIINIYEKSLLESQQNMTKEEKASNEEA